MPFRKKTPIFTVGRVKLQNKPNTIHISGHVPSESLSTGYCAACALCQVRVYRPSKLTSLDLSKMAFNLRRCIKRHQRSSFVGHRTVTENSTLAHPLSVYCMSLYPRLTKIFWGIRESACLSVCLSVCPSVSPPVFKILVILCREFLVLHQTLHIH